MNDNRFEVFISDNMDLGGLNIWITRKEFGGKESIVKPMQMDWEPMPEEGAIVRPSLTLTRRVAKEFLEAVQTAITNRGIPPVEQSKAEGLLEATKYHLEDMRRIVFKIKGGE